MKKIIHSVEKHIKMDESELNELKGEAKLNAFFIEAVLLLLLFLAGAGVGFIIKNVFF